MPLDLPPKLWLPQKPAIIRAASLDDAKLAMPLLGTFAAASARGLKALAAADAGYLYFRLTCTSNQDNTVTKIAEMEILVSSVDQIPAMSSGTTSGVTITGSNEGTSAAWKVGDNSAASSNGWQTTTAPPNYLTIQFSSPVSPDQYSLQGDASGGQHIYMPTTHTLKASNTGSFSGEEVTLHSVSGASNWSANEKRTYNL